LARDTNADAQQGAGRFQHRGDGRIAGPPAPLCLRDPPDGEISRESSRGLFCAAFHVFAADGDAHTRLELESLALQCHSKSLVLAVEKWDPGLLLQSSATNSGSWGHFGRTRAHAAKHNGTKVGKWASGSEVHASRLPSSDRLLVERFHRIPCISIAFTLERNILSYAEGRTFLGSRRDSVRKVESIDKAGA